MTRSLIIAIAQILDVQPYITTTINRAGRIRHPVLRFRFITTNPTIPPPLAKIFLDILTKIGALHTHYVESVFIADDEEKYKILHFTIEVLIPS